MEQMTWHEENFITAKAGRREIKNCTRRPHSISFCTFFLQTFISWHYYPEFSFSGAHYNVTWKCRLSFEKCSTS